jgi:cytochrome b subunit of formate dehydrogenase
MSPSGIRRALHDTHVLTTLVLIASGLLLTLPDLRALVVGGYGRQIARVHLWVGWISLAAPALALALAARPLWRDLRRRLAPPHPLAWRKIHIVFTLFSVLLLAVSGVLLWLDPGFPITVIDVLLEIHLLLTWALVAVIPLHLVVGWRKIVERTREILGLGSPTPLPFDPAEDDSVDPGP